MASSLAPNRDAAAIVLHSVPDTIFVGDSTPAFVDVNDKDGRPAWTDTVVVWVTAEQSRRVVFGVGFTAAGVLADARSTMLVVE